MTESRTGLYANIILLWLLAALVQFYFLPQVHEPITHADSVFAFLFVLGLPLLLIWGARLERKWAGWLGMVYGVLLILTCLKLVYWVIHQHDVPDIGLLMVFPGVIVGANIFTHSKALHRQMIGLPLDPNAESPMVPSDATPSTPSTDDQIADAFAEKSSNESSQEEPQ